MIAGTAPRQSTVDLAEQLEDTTIMYRLRREWNPDTMTFDYILKARLPRNERFVDTKLDHELGCILGSYWKQNEYGTFLGIHSMDWIIRHLRAGLEI